MPSANLVATAEWNGNKGLISNQQTHGADPQSFVVYTDILNDQQGRRRKRPGIGLPLNVAAAAAEVTQLHEFARVSPSSGAITYYQFRTYGAVIQRSTDAGGTWTTSPLGAIVFGGTGWQFCNSRNRCYAINGADGLFWFDSSTGPDGREWFVAGIATPTASMGYSLSAVDAPYSTGTVSVTKAAKLVVGSGATTWVTSGAWSQKYIDIAGVRYQIDTVTVAAPGQLNLTEEYRGETASGLTYTIYIGLMDWSEAPRYAYSYYSTVTGHSSNISPILQLTEKDVVGRTVRLSAIPYSPTDFNNGYDKIQLWRSAKDGSVLVAIDPTAGGRINNSSGAGTTTYTETANTYRDVNLTKFSAPVVSNRKPLNGADSAPAAFSTLAEWNGRLWGYDPREGVLRFSAISAEIEFGRSDECWPANNSLPVTDARALLRVGSAGDDTLIVMTGSGDKFLVGYNVLNYAVRDLGTDEAGGGLRSAAIAVASSFCALYADKRLVDYSRDDQQDIGRDIQDALSIIPDPYLDKVRIARFSYQDRKLLFISFPGTAVSTSNDTTYVYDYDASCWSRWSIGFSAFAVWHSPVNGGLFFVGARTSNAKLYWLLQPYTNAQYRDDGADFAPSMKTAVVRPFGYGKQAFYRWFKNYVNDAAQTWQLRIFVDEDTVGEAFTFDVADFRFQSANGKELVMPVTTTKKKACEAMQFETIWPSVNADLWIARQIAEWSLEQDVESRQ